MESGVPGVPGVAVLRPVEREVLQGPDYVTPLHPLMEELLVMEMKMKVHHVTILRVKVGAKYEVRMAVS